MYQLQLPFGEAVKRALTVNYCNFKGRASRSEYWWFMLFIFIAMIAVSVIFCWSETLSSIALGIVYLGILLPALGLSVRRMHDIGRSGWWLLINFIPLVGGIIYLVFTVKESEPVPNKWGDVPDIVKQ